MSKVNVWKSFLDKVFGLFWKNIIIYIGYKGKRNKKIQMNLKNILLNINVYKFCVAFNSLILILKSLFFTYKLELILKFF